MRGARSAAAATAALVFSNVASASISQAITVKGNAFFAGSDRFYIRGVDYQPGGSSQVDDPLADADACKRDIAAMKDLGINTLRVYTVDNSQNHDDCMSMLSDAGIYLILDVNTPKFAINRDYPEGSYNDVYLQHVFATIDVFKGYTNTLGFFSGNEVVNNANNTAAATVVKAVTRDMKAYIKKQSKRTIPVGYSAADVAENRRQMADFMNCGSDDERSDFFAFNDYSWCGDSSYTQSGWDQKVANYSDYSIPLFLSEFGCNEVTPRPFTEIKALYSSDMTKVFSGGLVYEFTQEDNNYGLVKVNGDSIDELTDFTTLKKQYAATPNPSGDGDYQSGLAASTCPAKTDLWQADSTLPDMPTSAQKYLASGAGKPLGTTGPTNQKEGNSTSSSTSSGSSTGSSSAASGSGSSSSKSGGAAGGREMALEGLFFSAVIGLATMAGAMFVL